MSLTHQKPYICRSKTFIPCNLEHTEDLVKKLNFCSLTFRVLIETFRKMSAEKFCRPLPCGSSAMSLRKFFNICFTRWSKRNNTLLHRWTVKTWEPQLLCIYFWLSWVFVAVRRLSLATVSGGHSVAMHGLLTVPASLVVGRGLPGAPAQQLQDLGSGAQAQ